MTSGSDGSCFPAYPCTAGPGYDGPTGLGTPNGVAAFTGRGTLNVVAISGSAIFHEQRSFDGSWTPLNFQTFAPAAITSSGASTDGSGNLQVAVAIGSAIYHDPFVAGNWSALSFQTSAPTPIGSISGAIA